jgi:hypothetical protein
MRGAFKNEHERNQHRSSWKIKASLRSAEEKPVIQFFSRMLKFPAAVAAASFDVMARIVRDMQQTFDRNVDVVAEGMAQTLMGKPEDGEQRSQETDDAGSEVAADESDESIPTTKKDGGNMGDWDGNDQDLSGEDVKVVQYRIIFTKRDYEATLYEHEETVAYPTNGGSFGALMISRFMGDLAKNGRKLPEIWQDSVDELKYPPCDLISDGKYFGIPYDDQKYITFLYKVMGRVDRQEKEYDKEQIKILDQIRRRL